jgi:two-component system, NtrC family, response regulator AtoC
VCSSDLLSASNVLQLDCLPPELRCAPCGKSAIGGAVEPADNRLEQAERDLLVEAIFKHQGNISAAARELGVTRDTIRYRIKKHGLQSG